MKMCRQSITEMYTEGIEQTGNLYVRMRGKEGEGRIWEETGEWWLWRSLTTSNNGKHEITSTL